ncbi:hypothetical protein AQPE_1695 [Aquipluma nitroreducens]|uniref:Uncharacterized protein n=1 Tax=Aquipluma nitroreducens TaxID=2010828 RepID=A0A5K7S7W6_9BACT|nr:hypothetical protein AQPE_1695 [Aquipluma nitroreducens]
MVICGIGIYFLFFSCFIRIYLFLLMFILAVSPAIVWE